MNHPSHSNAAIAAQNLDSAVDSICDKYPIDTTPNPTFQVEAINYHRIDHQAGNGALRDMPELKSLLEKLKKYAQTFPDPNLWHLADDMCRLLVGISTNVAEARCLLGLYRNVLVKRAPDVLVPRPDDSGSVSHDGTPLCSLDVALTYLNRISGIGGDNNSTPSKKFSMELIQSQQRVRKLAEIATEVLGISTESMSKAGSLISALGKTGPDDSERIDLMHIGFEYTDNIACLLEHYEERVKEITGPDFCLGEEEVAA